MDKEKYPKVTISFPVYNSSSYVKKSLQSVINQDYPNLEILIIDDFGNDDSMEKVKEILKSYQGDFQIISFGKNMKQGFGRNYSIEIASGKYIFFMDSDDLISLNSISNLVKNSELFNTDVTVGSYVRYNNLSNSKGVQYDEMHVVKGEYCLLKANFLSGLFFPAFMWNKLYNISFLKSNDIKCIHPYIEDDLFSFKVMIKALNCCFISNLTYYYNVENESSTTKKSMHLKNMTYKTAEIQMDIVKKKYDYINTMPNSIFKVRLLLQTIGTCIFHLYFIKNSKNISKKYTEKLLKTALNGIPEISISLNTEYSVLEYMKIIYYRFFLSMPFWLKKIILVIVNDKWYRFSEK